MSIRLQLPKLADLTPRLTVVGVGGAGCNAINNMIAAGLHGVEFVVANTDAQALAASSAEHRIQLGTNLTEGLGAGSKPEIGEAAAEEAIEDIRAQVQGSHMVFIAAGMGGGTGTGAASVIARVARELGILTVGVVTKPFQFEGARRLRIAEAGIAELRKVVDTLIVIPNQNLFRIANEKTTFAEAFVLADQVLYSGVACIVDLIVKEGLINLDFADVRTVMSGMGTAMMGTGEASGDRRAILAAEEAISNPLLDEVSLKGARGLLLSITGGRDLTLYEVDEAASRVRQEVDPEANIIVGATFDEALGDRVRVSIVASGMVRQGEKSMPGTFTEAAPPQAVWPRETPSSPQPAHAPPAPVARQPEIERMPEPPRSAVEVEPTMARTAAGAADMYAAPKADAVELQRRLSEAMPYSSESAAYSAPPVSQAPHAAGSASGHSHGYGHGGGHASEAAAQPEAQRETWRAPGNVMIEEGLPNLAGSQQAVRAPAVDRETQHDAYTREAYYGENSVAPDYGSFTPAAPNEIRRAQANRRMPEVEDFPVVGQRDYHAKSTGGMPDQASTPQQAPHQSAGASAGSEHRRKPGFFERLTGRGRHEEATNHAPESHESVRAAGRPASPSTGHAGGRSNPTAGVDRTAGRGQQGRTEGAELPVFFSRDRK